LFPHATILTAIRQKLGGKGEGLGDVNAEAFARGVAAAEQAGGCGSFGWWS
jgi:hypothetical protein